MRSRTLTIGIAAGMALMTAAPLSPLYASSHMDAPLITLDDPANTTDVYAFRSQSEDGQTQYLTTALAVYPFEEPGIGPNAYRFDDRVLYEIHVALEGDVGQGRKTISYQFAFETSYADEDTILQSYLGEVFPVDPAVVPVEARFDANQNMRQVYSVTRVDHRNGSETVLGQGIVPPNNQGLVTPFYNQKEDGEMPAKDGVALEADLDPYTRQAIAEVGGGYRAFAGQRDDGFFADIQAVFDLDFAFSGAAKPFDSQGGFNVHTIVLDIPLSEFGDATLAGVYATTSREVPNGKNGNGAPREYVQVGRQGNPLFAEAAVAIRDKDRYNETEPNKDQQRFGIYAEDPELAAVLGTSPLTDENGVSLIVGIFLPDLIKVDLTTGPARTPNDPGFRRLSVFAGDTLTNASGATVAGGWPNGRRFGDDVLDIALLALGVPPLAQGVPVLEFADADFDGVRENDITYNDVFPYAATPLNGRIHGHHGGAPEGAEGL